MQHDEYSASAQSPIGRRQHARLRTNLPVKITTLSLTAHGHLIDLSRGGAKFAAPRLISHGIEVLLHWPGSSALGEITWAEHRHCGVRFSDPIAAEVLMLARESGGTVPLSRVQELAAEFARERAYRERCNSGSERRTGNPVVAQIGRFGLRRV